MKTKLVDKIRGVFRSRRKPDAITFTGDYERWGDAVNASTGYQSANILEKTCAALLKVKSGEAAFERDSVLFDKPDHPFPILTGLLRAAMMNGDRLEVVDFGGSLGSSYFQCRQLLSAVRELRWSVIEQPAHVACGRRHFEDSELHFFETVDECLTRQKPHVLLLSGVLQYLSDPHSKLGQLLRHRFEHVILDRLPFLESDRDRLTVQAVPETIYSASYPAWFFSRTKFDVAMLEAGYECVVEFQGADKVSPEDEPAEFKGFIFQRKGPA